MNPQEFAQVFPLGSHLCRDPMPPMAELKHDMELLRREGFNLVKLQEHWACDEPREGEYDFSRHAELIEHAAGLDMGVYLGLTCEQAPAWLWRKHPGCRMVGRNGLPLAYEAPTTLPGDGKPGPCFDHHGAREDMVRFIGELVRALGRYENLVVWNTWQEVAYWAESIAGQPVCYCAHTLAHFLAWLGEHYGDLDGLNRAWNTRYGEWEDVLPSQGPRPQPQAVDLCWGYFMDNVQVARVLEVRAAAIREADPLGRPVFAHKGGPALGAGQDWTYARCQDFLGSSAYPAWGSVGPWDDRTCDDSGHLQRDPALLAETYDGVALRYDYLRSAQRPGAPVWAAEFQGGPVSTGLHKGRVPSPQDLRRWMLTAMSSGVTAISFWVTRAEIMASEQNGFSLLDSIGESTPRFAEVGRVGRALQAHADLFAAPSRPRAEVGILVNEWNWQLCSAMEGAARHVAHSTRGWHRLLWESSFPSDFVELNLAEPAELAAYPVLVLPFPLSLSDALADKLAAYVEQGGHLVSEACPGRLDEHAFCRRGELSPRLAELFGVEHESLALVREPGGEARWSPAERTWGEYLEATVLAGCGPLEGCRLRANLYVETYRPGAGEPSLKHGERVAGVRCQQGAGSAWLLGTLAGHGGASYRNPVTVQTVLRLLENCGVTRAHDGELLLSKRVVGAREAWLFTNPTGEDLTEEVEVPAGSRVADLLGEPLARSGDAVTVMVPGLDVRVLIVEREGA